MKFIILMILLVMNIGIANADSIKVQINPLKPVKGEAYSLLFEVETNSSADPYISFDPGRADVLGKRNRGVSISTTFINGKVSTNRVIRIEYELISGGAGRHTIRDIQVEIDGRVFQHKSISYNVQNQRERLSDVFMVAVPSKTDVYLGEAIDVEYYLYYKVPVVASELKQYPKLKNFLKRFHMPDETPERVNYQGEIYTRSLKYSSRLYPDKTGTVYIDPLRLSVQYAQRSGGNPFGFSGLNLGVVQYKTKTVASERVDINVKPLPAEGVPPGFTGLVGEHKFTLTSTGNKFLVNEPIEMKLVVEGEGALEKMSAPTLYKHDNLEQFDTKSEVQEIRGIGARKIFDYTFLARGGLKIEKDFLSLAYFDPESKSYVVKEVPLPGLEVGGSRSASTRSDGRARPQVSPNKTDTPTPSARSVGDLGMVAPHFSPSKFGNSLWDYINYLLGFLILLALLDFARREGLLKLGRSSIEKDIAELKKQMNYSILRKVLLRLVRKDSDYTDIVQMINESQLSDDAKSYFAQLVDVAERAGYKDADTEIGTEFNSVFFDELVRITKESRKRVESAAS